MTEEDKSNLIEFNQASFHQQRIDELFSRVDRLSANPLEWNVEGGDWNYKIMFRDLSSLYATTSSTFTENEDEFICKLKDKLKAFIDNHDVYEKRTSRGWTVTEKVILHKEVWKVIEDYLFAFRVKLENLMYKHGFIPQKKVEGGWN